MKLGCASMSCTTTWPSKQAQASCNLRIMHAAMHAAMFEGPALGPESETHQLSHCHAPKEQWPPCIACSMMPRPWACHMGLNMPAQIVPPPCSSGPAPTLPARLTTVLSKSNGSIFTSGVAGLPAFAGGEGASAAWMVARLAKRRMARYGVGDFILKNECL